MCEKRAKRESVSAERGRAGGNWLNRDIVSSTRLESLKKGESIENYARETSLRRRRGRCVRIEGRYSQENKAREESRKSEIRSIKEENRGEHCKNLAYPKTRTQNRLLHRKDTLYKRMANLA